MPTATRSTDAGSSSCFRTLDSGGREGSFDFNPGTIAAGGAVIDFSGAGVGPYALENIEVANNVFTDATARIYAWNGSRASPKILCRSLVDGAEITGDQSGDTLYLNVKFSSRK